MRLVQTRSRLRVRTHSRQGHRPSPSHFPSLILISPLPRTSPIHRCTPSRHRLPHQPRLQCPLAQHRHLWPKRNPPRRLQCPSNRTKRAHATPLACPRLHHLHPFPAPQPSSSWRTTLASPNHSSRKAQCRSSPKRQACQRPRSRVLRPHSLPVVLAAHRLLRLRPRR